MTFACSLFPQTPNPHPLYYSRILSLSREFFPRCASGPAVCPLPPNQPVTTVFFVAPVCSTSRVCMPPTETCAPIFLPQSLPVSKRVLRPSRRTSGWRHAALACHAASRQCLLCTVSTARRLRKEAVDGLELGACFATAAPPRHRAPGRLGLVNSACAAAPRRHNRTVRGLDLLLRHCPGLQRPRICGTAEERPSQACASYRRPARQLQRT